MLVLLLVIILIILCFLLYRSLQAQRRPKQTAEAELRIQSIYRFDDRASGGRCPVCDGIPSKDSGKCSVCGSEI